MPEGNRFYDSISNKRQSAKTMPLEDKPGIRIFGLKEEASRRLINSG